MTHIPGSYEAAFAEDPILNEIEGRLAMAEAGLSQALNASASGSAGTGREVMNLLATMMARREETGTAPQETPAAPTQPDTTGQAVAAGLSALGQAAGAIGGAVAAGSGSASLAVASSATPGGSGTSAAPTASAPSATTPAPTPESTADAAAPATPPAETTPATRTAAPHAERSSATSRPRRRPTPPTRPTSPARPTTPTPPPSRGGGDGARGDAIVPGIPDSDDGGGATTVMAGDVAVLIPTGGEGGAGDSGSIDWSAVGADPRGDAGHPFILTDDSSFGGGRFDLPGLLGPRRRVP